MCAIDKTMCCSPKQVTLAGINFTPTEYINHTKMKTFFIKDMLAEEKTPNSGLSSNSNMTILKR